MKKISVFTDKFKFISKVNYGNRFYFYIDESGNHDNRHIKKIAEHVNNPESKYLEAPDEAFSLTGILIKGSQLKLMKSEVDALKIKYFGSLLNNKNIPIVIHRKDFGQKAPFRDGDNFDKKKFELELEDIYAKYNFKVYSISINKLILFSEGKIEADSRLDQRIYLRSVKSLLDMVYSDKENKIRRITCVFESIDDKSNNKIHNFIRENLHNWPIISGLYFSPKVVSGESVLGLECADYMAMNNFRFALCRDFHRTSKKINGYPNIMFNGLTMSI